MSENPSSSNPHVAVVATLDTKGAEARFLAQELAARGVRPLLIDLSLKGTSPSDATITRADLAARGATEAGGDDRTTAMETTSAAAAQVLQELVARHDIDGVIGLGGGTGGWMSQRAFEPLPFGFPKIVVTTVVKASGEHDILFLPSVVDVAGLGSLLRAVLRNAAAAVAGMAAARPAAPRPDDRPAVAMTMFGVTTSGGDVARATLEEAGYDVAVFHATGAGGRTMERLVAEGHFAGVLDWTTTELVQNVAGGLCDAGTGRLDSAARVGVPQVVVPGAVDVVNVLPPIPEAFAGRAHHWHLPTVPLVRSSVAETAAAGRWVGERLRRAAGPSVVLVPEAGFSSLDIRGGPFEDAEADSAFAESVLAAGDIAVRTSPLHINDAAFAREAAQALLSLMRNPSPHPSTPKE